jgi:putative membrane protein
MTGPGDTSAPDAARPGLAVERTALAWRRTGLALATGSLAAGRLLETVWGPVSWWLAALGLLLAVVVVASAQVRAAAAHHEPGDPATERVEATAGVVRRTGGRLVTACAAGATLLGLVGLAIVLGLA